MDLLLDNLFLRRLDGVMMVMMLFLNRLVMMHYRSLKLFFAGLFTVFVRAWVLLSGPLFAARTRL